MVFSLGLVLAVVHLPFGHDASGVGWYVANRGEALTVDFFENIDPLPEEDGSPITRFDDGEKMDAGNQPESEETLPEPLPEPAPQIPERKLTPLLGRKVLDFAQQMPEIVGGLGAYYIHITYPQAAIAAGIEGRLVLSFVVDTRGFTDEIEVVQPLFPACDSAAVQALRNTRFVPGRQNGQTVPVRMRLPVRFKLLNQAEAKRANQVGL